MLSLVLELDEIDARFAERIVRETVGWASKLTAPARAAVRDKGHFLPADEHDRKSSCNQMSSGAWVTDLPEELVKLFAGTYLQAAASHLRSVERLFLVVRGVCAALRVWEFAALEELHVIRAGKANAERAGTAEGGAWDDDNSRQWLCALVNDTARFCFDKDANPSLVEVRSVLAVETRRRRSRARPRISMLRIQNRSPFAGALPGDAALDRRRRAARAREQLPRRPRGRPRARGAGRDRRHVRAPVRRRAAAAASRGASPRPTRSPTRSPRPPKRGRGGARSRARSSTA